jgi:chitin deacetylase
LEPGVSYFRLISHVVSLSDIFCLSTDDWTLDQTPPGTTLDKVGTQMQTWLTGWWRWFVSLCALLNVVNMQGPKTPGLVILEHELSELSVASFISAYPLMVSNGWKVVSLAQTDGLGVYQNAFDLASPVTPAQVGDPNIRLPLANTSALPTYTTR